MTQQCPYCDQTPVQPCPAVSTSVHLSPPSWSQNTEPVVRIHRQNWYCRLLLFASSNLITPTSRGSSHGRFNFGWAFLHFSHLILTNGDERRTYDNKEGKVRLRAPWFIKVATSWAQRDHIITPTYKGVIPLSLYSFENMEFSLWVGEIPFTVLDELFNVLLRTIVLLV